MRSELRDCLRAVLASAAALGVLHFATLLSALGGWLQISGGIKQAILEIGGELVLFQLGLALAVTTFGAAAGAAAWVALRTLRSARPRPFACGLLGVALALVQLLRTLTHKPALFEDLLWRRGGWRASLQVLLVERIGAGALDRALLAALALALALALFRHRRALLGRKELVFAAVAVLLLAGLAIRSRARPRPRSTRGIVVLAADSLRPDHFSSSGYPQATTPNLDALLPRSAHADDVFVPIASTTASWSSMLTGVYPHRHGIRDLFPRAETTRMRLPTLPRILASAGYRTAVVSDYAGETFQRVDFGFEVVDAPPATSIEVFAEREAVQRLPLALGLLAGPLGQRLFPVMRYLLVNADPAELTDRAFRRLDALEQGGQPFLLVVFYSVTHAPFAAPMPDARRFAAPGESGNSRYGYEIQQLADIARAGRRPPEEEVAQVRALYDGALHSFDREVGRFEARLAEDGLAEHLLAITGDHGESLFEPGATTEHGKWFQGGEAANRTLLWLEGAGVKPGPLPPLASGVDFLPTLLAAAGIPAPLGLDGISLFSEVPADRTVFAETSLWLGGKDDSPPGSLTYPAITELLEVENGSRALVLKQRFVERTITARLRAARSGRWELTCQPTEGGAVYRLLDLQADPFGLIDVSQTHPEVALELRRKLRAWMSEDRLRWFDADDHLVARREQ